MLNKLSLLCPSKRSHKIFCFRKSFSSKTATIQNPSQFYSNFRNTQKSPYNANEIQDLTLISQTTRHTGIQIATNQYCLLSIQTKFCISLNLSSLYTCLQLALFYFDNSQFKKIKLKNCSQWHNILSIIFFSNTDS